MRAQFDAIHRPQNVLLFFSLPMSEKNNSAGAKAAERGLDPEAEAGAFEADVRVEQIRYLFRSALAFPINIFNTAVAALVLRSVFPVLIVALWLVAACLVTGARYALWQAFQRRQPGPEQMAAWGRWFTVGATISGSLWGLLAWTIVLDHAPHHELFVIFVIGGMMAGAVLFDSTYLPALAGFSIPIGLPALVLLFTVRGAFSVEMGLLLGAFVSVLGMSAWNLNQWVAGSVRLRLQQQALTTRLRQSTVGLELEVAARRRAEEELRSMSLRDGLTSLYNRRFLGESAKLEFARAMRTGAATGVIMCDIDHFKYINDSYTHGGGDAVLSAVGQLLAKALRATDIACRYGGEEFVIILPGSSLEQTRMVAESLREAVRAMQVSYEGQAIGPVTMSFGVAAAPDHGDTPDHVIHIADMAMYRAKQAGRDRVEVAGVEPGWPHVVRDAAHWHSPPRMFAAG